MKALDVIILAAGKGERMVSETPKVLHGIMGKAMIDYVVEAAQRVNPAHIVVVTGHGREKVEAHLEKLRVSCAVQREQKGTAHALLCAKELLGDRDLLVLYGDVPLMEPKTLEDFILAGRRDGLITFMTTNIEDPHGYGRVLTNGEYILEIREEIDATPQERAIKEINTGICYIPAASLGYVKEIDAKNRKGEYYLTDICRIAAGHGDKVKVFRHQNSAEVLGINSRKELTEANMVMRKRNMEKHQTRGVTFLDDSVFIDDGVEIGQDTTIYPNCHITGKTTIGKGVTIGPNAVIADCLIGDHVTIEAFVVMEGAHLKSGVKAGPFARLRPKSVIEKDAKIGNFVEIKNTFFGEGSKANHLAYVGDASVGKGVNIGAGTITCNYDGVNKYRTTLDDNVFVGSNTELVAPVKVGRNAVIGAGSTITKDVPEEALAVSRVQQKHIEGYRRKKKCVE